MDSMKDLKVPKELRDKWRKEAPWDFRDYIQLSDYLIAQAAQWAWDQREPEIQAAADAELEACLRHFEWHPQSLIDDLRAARRPEPLSLKEQAIELFKHRELHRDMVFNPQNVNTILRALEALPDE